MRDDENAMALVLGIDAAWTETGSSGVALLRVGKGKRSVLKVASSYAGFLTGGVEGRRVPGTRPDVEALLRKAENIAGDVVNVVAIDMPIARTRFVGRRVADNKVSEAFGASWASTHTPNAERPGLHGEQIADAFAKAGYPIATDRSQVNLGHALVEVYPLAALVRLFNATVRPAYKVAKMARYFRTESPQLSRDQRIDRLLNTWADILAALRSEISVMRFELPDRSKLKFAADLKPYEDKLDALISAWVGACVLEGRAEPLGNDDCAIWVPMKLSGAT
jgi:predicted RNase H-like nuclease